jgi:hypothetical protein
MILRPISSITHLSRVDGQLAMVGNTSFTDYVRVARDSPRGTILNLPPQFATMRGYFPETGFSFLLSR